MIRYYPRTSTVRRMAGERRDAGDIVFLTGTTVVSAKDVDPAYNMALPYWPKTLVWPVLSENAPWPTTHPRCVS